MSSHSRSPRSPDRRHAVNDNDDDGKSPSPKRRRLQRNDTESSSHRTVHRRKKACQSCRLRKIKCDAVRPVCGICKVSDSTCHYTDPLPEKLTLESSTDLLSGKLDDIKSKIDELQGVVPPDSSSTQNGVNGKHHCVRKSNSDRPRQPSGIYIAEPSKDFLHIPAHRTTADAVLNWEVFEGRYPSMALISFFFKPTHEDQFHVAGGILPANEEQIPLLVDKFLQNVHTKNPVLDVEQLVQHARMTASHGLGWDAWTCLVLLASALGTIAKPFDASITISQSPIISRERLASWTADAPASTAELQQADSYFALACRRLGCLRHSILGSQCYFFAGVYLMYTLRPLYSWQYFTQASNFYQLYMKTTHELAADISHLGQLPVQDSAPQDSKQRRLEESMYWSCFKSESEFRVELPLPQTELANYSHPQMFPSPPSPAAGRKHEFAQVLSDVVEPPSNGSMLHGLRRTSSNATSAETFDLRQHAKQLCNEEESWYYYLTEIALRRIGNRIINTFFNDDVSAWMDIRPLLSIALEFDTQASAWSANLPAAMQHWETNYSIRAPTFESLVDGRANHVSRELSWATDNRLLEMRSWLYQPFLYYFMHNGLATIGMSPVSRDEFVAAAAEGPSRLSDDDANALYHFVTSGIDCNLRIMDVRSLRHRHHGLWYDMRSTMCASLILLAMVKSGHEEWIPGGAEMLWGLEVQSHPHDQPIAGRIGHVMDEFEFWSGESPDLTRHRDVLEDVTRMVQSSWFARRQS